MSENRFNLIETLRGLSEDEWAKWQKIIGAILGLGVGACIFFIKDSGGFIPINFLAGFVVAITAPNYLERRTERSFRTGRMVLIGVLAACIVGYLIYIAATGGFANGIFTAQPTPAPTLPIITPAPTSIA